jgi:hypothetical protein
LSIDVNRFGCIGFNIGRAAGAVKDVISGEMDHADALPSAFLGQNPYGMSVHFMGRFRVGFAVVDAGEGGCVDQPFRPDILKSLGCGSRSFPIARRLRL